MRNMICDDVSWFRVDGLPIRSTARSRVGT